ncbi:MAG TPA: hypothetical protein PLT82_11165 [Candidatus Hydrogenedens sp.]|nr:hypothetical protein [Candidatus Hydrogenedens sp.]HOK10575.1 hypothetical protein [Candidatus Hydrogenedens sp.]HOL20964.1 hypothetical protein [Candidatus Hydrogenedens sp.]HPP59682.1 hypothetical protein [Candidatus Hydrogenedens sp.]
MREVLMSLPLLFVVVTTFYFAFRAIMRVWIQYRVRLALLERLEETPELLDEIPQIRELFEIEQDELHESYPIDFVFTGAFLVLFGLIFVIFDFLLGTGQVAVGAYWGGVICSGLGFIIALLGLFLRFLSRPINI